jgi:hypothetical protein
MLVLLFLGIYIGWTRQQYSFFPIQFMALSGLVWTISLAFIHPFKARRHQSKLDDDIIPISPTEQDKVSRKIDLNISNPHICRGKRYSYKTIMKS